MKVLRSVMSMASKLVKIGASERGKGMLKWQRFLLIAYLGLQDEIVQLKE
jgi:hypothetical protein